MSASSPTVVLVVGVGRSGTSLAMQALRRLGAAVSERMVPATEANRRGPLEDWEVRNEMIALWRALGRFEGLRPADWRDAEVTRQAQGWLADHLGRSARVAEAPFAVKYPIASLFLPLWQDAAAQADVALRLIWATRRTEAVLKSFGASYSYRRDLAESAYAQRALYLLEDAPADAFVLPYEGWTKQPRQQIAALAEAAGLPLADPRATLHDLFDPDEDRSGDGEGPGLPPALRTLEEAMAGRHGRLGTIVEDGMRARLARDLTEMLMEHETEADAAGTPGAKADKAPAQAVEDKSAGVKSDEAKPLSRASSLRAERDMLREDMRRLRVERDEAQAAAARLRGNRDTWRKKAEEAQAEVGRMRRACEALTRERDRGDKTMADMASRHATASGVADARVVQAQATAKATRAKLEVAAAERRREAEAAKETAKALRKRLNGQKRAAREKAGALRDQLERKSAQAAKAQARAENRVKRIALLKKRIAEAPEGTRAVIAVPGAAQASETRSPVAVRRGRALVPELVRRAGRRVVALPARLVRDRKRPD